MNKKIICKLLTLSILCAFTSTLVAYSTDSTIYSPQYISIET